MLLSQDQLLTTTAAPTTTTIATTTTQITTTLPPTTQLNTTSTTTTTTQLLTFPTTERTINNKTLPPIFVNISTEQHTTPQTTNVTTTTTTSLATTRQPCSIIDSIGKCAAIPRWKSPLHILTRRCDNGFCPQSYQCVPSNHCCPHNTFYREATNKTAYPHCVLRKLKRSILPFNPCNGYDIYESSLRISVQNGYVVNEKIGNSCTAYTPVVLASHHDTSCLFNPTEIEDCYDGKPTIGSLYPTKNCSTAQWKEYCPITKSVCKTPHFLGRV